MIVRQRAFQWTDYWIHANIVAADIERYPVYNTGLGVLYEGDCLEILPLIRNETIDTVFADPPFNLAKNYGSRVTDKLPDDKYINWSKEWLRECVRLLKPGGALFVYNLPKWNLILGNYLMEMGLLFRHSIAKEAARFGGSLEGLVPPAIEERLGKAFKTADLQTSH